MFAQDWSEAGRKRTREDEYEDIAIGGSLGFTEHRSKRLQSLPLRTSPTSKRWAAPSFPQPSAVPYPHQPPTITPSDSDSEDVNNGARQPSQPEYEQPKSHFSPWSSPTVVMSQDPSPFQHAPEMVDRYLSGDTDMDMDMNADVDHVGNISDPTHLEPGSSQPDPIAPTITGRMPTPIHCSFAAQVRGNNWGGAAGNVMQASGMTPPYQPEGLSSGFGHGAGADAFASDQSVPRSMEHTTAMADWSMVQNRRLPSPISESGCEEMISPRMVLDGSPHIHHARPSVPQRASSAIELAQALREGSVVSTMSDNGGAPLSSAAAGDDADCNGNMMDVEPSATTPSPKKGHSRSRHTVNNWTLQPGMKKSFSIGYRADCEKCRLKVPGHFNHIIIS